MVIINFGSSFLKADNCKTGNIVEILDEGNIQTIKTPEGTEKKVLNLTVKHEGEEKTFTPNRTNGKQLEDAWGKDTKNWKGKQFKIELCKAMIFGKSQNTIMVEPLVDPNEQPKVEEEVVLWEL